MQKMALVSLSQKHSEQLSGWLIKNAEGNPFFITELVRYAQGIGLLKKDGALDMELLALVAGHPCHDPKPDRITPVETIGKRRSASCMLRRSSDASLTLNLAKQVACII